VKLVVTTNFGCKDSIIKTVVVDPKPNAAFSNKNVCYGGTSIFSDKSTVKTGRLTDVFWNFGDSTDLTGEVVMHHYKYSGTYNVRLVVRSEKGCVDTLTKATSVYKLPAALITASGPLDFCFGGSVTLTTPSGTGYKYAWSDGSITNFIKVSKSGTVKVLVTDTAGCQNSDSAKVVVYPLPLADAGKDTTVSKGFPAHLHGNGGVRYSWTPSGSLDNDTLQNPTATPLTTTSYVLTVKDIHGCSSSDTVIVNVVLDFRLDTYNTITPNGDGMNDAFVIDNIGTYPGATVTIYNRYGVVLYQSTDYKNDWKGTYNGTDVPQGTYYYTVTFKDSDKVYKGAINILRNE
jgi:gliding motility-associated-like protein